MDTGTIVLLGGLVVLLILIGFASSFIRSKRGRVDPPQGVLEIREDGDSSMPVRPTGEDDDEFAARSEEQAVDDAAAEQERALRHIREAVDADDAVDGNDSDRET